MLLLQGQTMHLTGVWLLITKITAGKEAWKGSTAGRWSSARYRARLPFCTRALAKNKKMRLRLLWICEQENKSFEKGPRLRSAGSLSYTLALSFILFLALSQLTVGLYEFVVTVDGEGAHGEGYVNVTVKPGGFQILVHSCSEFTVTQEKSIVTWFSWIPFSVGEQVG